MFILFLFKSHKGIYVEKELIDNAAILVKLLSGEISFEELLIVSSKPSNVSSRTGEITRMR